MFPCAAIPRPEYPRPDRQRGRVEGVDWLNLNGPWQFRFDPERRGREEQWFAAGGVEWREQIIVPFCWESLAAWGEGEAAANENYFSTRVYVNPLEVTRANHRAAARHEVGWYRRHVRVPTGAAWANKRVILTIGAADFFTEVWCNGQAVGRHEGGYIPSEYDLTDTLRQAADDAGVEALIVIRVEDPMDNREQPVGKQWGWYTPTSGIWQTVFVEPRAPAHVRHFRILPDVDEGKVAFEVFCRGTTDTMEVEIDIVPPAGAPHRVRLHVFADVATGETEIDPVILWDPSDPRIYRVIFRLGDEQREHDVVRGYFGMRKISTQPAPDENAPAMLCLNNKPIYLRGALYQSYHPAGIYTAPDARVLAGDIAYAREAGFDFLRVHIKLDDPILLYYADTIGILLMQDLPNFGEGGDTALGRRRFEEMMRRGIQRDFNHPAIIAWCLFNETWGFGGQTELMKWIGPLAGKTPAAASERIANETSFEWVHRMWEIAKTLDQTRLIEDMSVVAWEHLKAYGHVDTDINSWHFYLDDYERAKAHIADVVAKSYRGSKFNFVEGFEQKNAPLINSEYGGVGALDGNRDCSWSFKFLTNELRRHPQLSAYIYTELHDVEWEYNGFLTYDRTRKQFGYAPSMINSGDVLPINAAPISVRRPGEAMEVEVVSSHFSRRRRENVALHWLYTGIDTLGRIHPELGRGRAEVTFPHYHVEVAQRVRLTAPRENMLCTLAVSAVTAEGELVASNFIHHQVSDGEFKDQEWRDEGKTLVLRRRVHEWSGAEWSDGGNTPEEAARDGYGFGRGGGFFEWIFEADALRDFGRARRLRVLAELSARREDEPQTSAIGWPTVVEVAVNGVRVHRELLPDHPHDARGALTYLRGGRGAYGYLVRATIEGALLERVAAAADGALRLRCTVPGRDVAVGGLTVYAADAGRFPLGPTALVEWEQT